MLRWTCPLHYFRRTATCDTEVAGQAIKENDRVIMLYSSANFDETVFDKPEEFDIYHTAIYRNGKYYDTRGEISREEVGSVAPLGLTTDTSEKPKEGRDYLVFSYVIDDPDSLAYIKEVIENNTNWTNTCEFYGDRATKFWDKADGGIKEEWSSAERKKRKDKCSNPKGFTMKQFCKNQRTKSKKGERKN
jgi:hypothetical protein